MKIIIIGLLIFIDLLVPLIMKFLSVEATVYINYLGWINALGIFYLILPKRVSSSKFL